jgi:CRISPR-associated protein Cmr2
MDDHLFLFSIGPVQTFIAAGRRTSDLAVGSRLLSTIAAAGVREALHHEAHILFPALRDGQPPTSTPHRFAFVGVGDPFTVGRTIQDAIEAELQYWVRQVEEYLVGKLGEGPWQQLYDEQAAGWLEIHWVAVPYLPDQHGTCFMEAGRALATRKLSRTFSQAREDDTGRQKCSVTGTQSALPLDWKRLDHALGNPFVLKNSADGRVEMLGGLALMKRLLPEVAEPFEGRYPSTSFIASGHDERAVLDEGRDVEGYLAVLHFDGDRMGQHLNDLHSFEEHVAFSEALAAFAEDSERIIAAKTERGVLIYAGGDDVLALLPLSDALSVCDALRRSFAEHMTSFGTLTGSAGMAVTPASHPLSVALKRARDAEDHAKDVLGRNALSISEMSRGGQIRQAGGKWTYGDINLIELTDQFRQAFHGEDAWLSGKFGYDLKEAARFFDVIGIEGRQAEIRRLIRRRAGEHRRAEEIVEMQNTITSPLIALGEEETLGWEALANLIILARFLAQGDASRLERREEPV